MTTVDPHPRPVGHGAHEPHLAHHFDTQQQQFEAGKFGIWVFLITEILFFSGLFCAYAIYRASHPEVFHYAHQFLDTRLGAINTAVLIFSSLTMAWAVRCAQLGQQRGLVLCLAITLLCAFTFLGVKWVEYEHKWKDGLLPGRLYQPTAHATPEPGHRVEPVATPASVPAPTPKNVHLFFGVYFSMTGLHALHVIGGIVVIFWILLRSLKGHFGPRYFGPVDYVALYWHLVDLVWIYLFPLLYLIS